MGSGTGGISPEQIANGIFFVLGAAIFVVLALLMARWIARVMTLVRSFRRSPLDCQHCGYSLVRNTSGVCPECGTPVRP